MWAEVMQDCPMGIKKWLDVEDVDRPDTFTEELLTCGEVGRGFATDLDAPREVVGGGNPRDQRRLARVGKGDDFAKLGPAMGSDDDGLAAAEQFALEGKPSDFATQAVTNPVVPLHNPPSTDILVSISSLAANGVNSNP